MCYQGCVDEIPNFPLLDLAQGPHTFLGAGGVNRLPHHTPGPSGIASLDPQTVLQYLTLCVTTIMRP